MKSRKQLPTQERLRELFNYHPDGYFIRRIKTGPTTHVGQEVRGSPSGAYLLARVDTTQYLLHRLIFQWHHGWCPDEIDHEDRNSGNCRVGNLIKAMHSENALNCDLRRNNTTGVTGIYRDQYGQFYAAPRRAGIRFSPLGRYKTVEEAVASLEAFDVLAC